MKRSLTMRLFSAVFRVTPGAVAIAGTVLAAACSIATTGDISNPVTRKLTWFSYLNGDDIRRTCRRGSDDRLRLVFNGRYEDQVRIYELRDGASARLDIRILSPIIVNQFGLGELQNQLSGRTEIVRLGEAHADVLWQAVEAAGAFTPPPAGLRLDSQDLWWTGVGCRNGEVFFHAWEVTPDMPSPSFAPVIADFDPTGIPWPPATDTNFDIRSPNEAGERVEFTLEVGRNGLRL